MKINIFAKISVNMSGYVKVEDTDLNDSLENKYEDQLDFVKSVGGGKTETFEGFKLQYINLDVTLDRRKKKIVNKDILDSMYKDGIISKSGDNIFGGLYVATDELKQMLTDNLAARRELINQEKLVVV